LPWWPSIILPCGKGAVVNPTFTLTDDILDACLKCRYKAHLQLGGNEGEASEYLLLQTRLAGEYRVAARQEIARNCDPASVIVSPPSLTDALRCRPDLILDVQAADADESCRIDALERLPGGAYTPALFVPHQRVGAYDRMRLAFGASVLARVQGVPPSTGRIVHGPHFRSTRVNLATLYGSVRGALGQIRAICLAATPPPMVLNRHCAECEFRRSCHARAIEKDDLSLLRGLSAKEVAGLNNRGIFTVHQLSHTFRPGRLKRVRETGGRHEQALQALAVREKKIYIARLPRLPDGRVRAYLDVEGLPDRDLYYLIGLCAEDGERMWRSSFWADREVDERCIWDAFLGAIRGLGEDYVLYHYGSYEARFLRQMRERHGGDPEILARFEARAVNVLAAIHARVYFPTYANDLKSVAGCLGFRWSAADASGLQSIVWRHAWAANGDEGMKLRLLTYNQEDCSALQCVVSAVRSFEDESIPSDGRPGPPVAGLDEIEPPVHRKYGQSKFARPEFAEITKRAYFDYQRDKVLCRTSPAVKQSLRRKHRPRRLTWRVNQEVECEDVKVCPYCGATVLDTSSRYQRCVIDLRPFRGGLKRWVTRYRVIRRRCRRCWKTFLPEAYRALPSKYGWGICSWVVHASISLRMTNDAVAESLHDLFDVPIPAGMVSRIRQDAVEHYQATYKALIDELRRSPVVHADETRVEVKGPNGNGYVWVFASPDTTVYVYAPTRDGVTAQETLAGFTGVLVSDFYAAYDSIECPRQKCLIHLIRDLNDDLLKNPFDEELKQVAARFTAVLQPVIGTVDRFGLKKYHLGKHKPAVDRFFATLSEAEYHSETARHYRSRFLKHQGALFTFLDYDGVPWNNNNAENAVKLFASRRKVMATPFTERGIKGYLLLLSLYQTLRYRGLGLWKFLLSEQTDIAAFATSRR
jgi:predicted RecB family nuclease